MLRAASKDVQAVGHANVRGVPTTRYAGKMDFRKALDAGLDQLELSEAERARARDGMQALLEQLGSASLPFEVFVDEDGLLRRMTMYMSMKIQSERMSMRMSMDYFDFGVEGRRPGTARRPTSPTSAVCCPEPGRARARALH